MKLKTILIFLILSFFSINVFANYEKSVVKISSNLFLYDYKKPWKKPKKKQVMGSGVIIENQYILTSAHVVSNAKTIEIKKSNDSKKYYAKLKYIYQQADLALLEVFNKEFFKNTKALKLNTKVKVGQKIEIVGYPLGRNDIASNKGLVSKIKINSYSWSNEDFLALEIKAFSRPGNSGGPILNKDGDILAIAMQKAENYKNIVYATPSFIINTFLQDIKDNKIEGLHSNSNSYQYLKNNTIKEYYKIKDDAILVTDIDINEKQLKVDDIILQINGHNVFNISLEEFSKQFLEKELGKTISIHLLRNQKLKNIEYKLNYSKKIIEHEFENKPRYFIFAGLVFTPITRNYLQAIGMKQYEINMLYYKEKRTKELDEPVAWLEYKFYHKLNKDYNSKVEIVEKVNGIKVKSFRHFVDIINDCDDEYIKIDFSKKQTLVFKKEEALKSFLDIKRRYKLLEDRNLY